MGDSPSVFKSLNPLACTSAILCVSPRISQQRQQQRQTTVRTEKREKVRARSKSPETVNYKWKCRFCTSKVPTGSIDAAESLQRLSCWPPCLTKIDTYYLPQAVRPKQNRDYLATRRTDTTGHVKTYRRKRIAPEFIIHNNPSSGELYCPTIRDGIISKLLLPQPAATSRGHPIPRFNDPVVS